MWPLIATLLTTLIGAGVAGSSTNSEQLFKNRKRANNPYTDATWTIQTDNAQPSKRKRATSEEIQRKKEKERRRSLTPPIENNNASVDLLNTRYHFCKKFNVYCYEAKLNFEGLRGKVQMGTIESLTQRGIDLFVMKYMKNSKSKEKFDDVTFSLQLNHPSLKDLRKKAVYLPPRTRYQNNAFALYSLLDKFMQSNESIKLDNQMSVMLTARPNPMGGTCSTTVNDFSQPNTPDNYCLPRAIARGYAKILVDNFQQIWNQDHPSTSKVYKSQGFKKVKAQFDELKQDHVKAKETGIHLCKMFIPDFDENENRKMGIEDIRQLDQKMSTSCRIFVYNDYTGHTMYTSMTSNTSLPILKLIYSEINEHYDLMITPRAYFNGITRPDLRYLCQYCGVIVSRKEFHQRCIFTCINCNQPGKCKYDTREAKSCINCKITFGNEKCFNDHFFRGKCIARRYKCLECNKLFYNTPYPMNLHKCHQTHWCGKCQDYKDSSHKCAWGPLTDERRKEIQTSLTRFKYIFYDFETSPNTVNEDGQIEMRDTQHVTHAVVMKVCNQCCPKELLPDNVETKYNSSKTPCSRCKESVKVFGPEPGDSETSVLDRFCTWLFVTGNNHYYKAIAHNGGNFDAHFVLQWLLTNNVNPEVIMNGQSLLSLKTKRPRKMKPAEHTETNLITLQKTHHKFPMIYSVTCLDSRNFIPLPLSKFADTFELEEGKGFFPIFANCPYFENRTEYPGPEFFGADKKSSTERNKILAFIQEMRQSGKTFNLQEEIVRYCKQDVKVMMEGCMKFRKIFIETSEIDPFAQCITLASACLLTFRLNHHDAEKYPIAHIPENGYNQNQVQSRLAEQMIHWLEKTRGIRIQHKGNGGEKEVILNSGRKVFFDGYYKDCNGNDCVIEVHGDIWHGCHVCYLKRDYKNPLNGFTMDQLLQETNQRISEIEADGFVVEQFWECEIHAMLRYDEKMRDFFNNLDIVGRLQPREAFMGGRTQTFNMITEANDDEEIFYFDVCSLYPYINCSAEYPIGEPTVICPKDIKEVYKMDKVMKQNLLLKGLYYCTVLPPRKMKIALLPIKHKGMLMYTLCRTCMEIVVASGENQGQKECTHTPKERSIRQIWHYEELQYALDNGYTILEVHEVWIWDQWTEGATNGKIPDNGLFTSYMRTFFRMKQEASGYPSECQTENDKDQFIKKFEEENGIKLRKERLEKPSMGMRYCSKIKCNSLWGRFGMKAVKTSVAFCRTKEEVDMIWFNDNIDITMDGLMGDNIWMFAYKPKREILHSTAYGSLAVAITTTARARLHLTKLLVELTADRVIYCDTDSVLFKCKKNDPEMNEFKKRHLGKNLGQLTDEIPKGWKITKVVSPGCKQYGYIMENEEGEQKEVVKMRGISQNYSTKDLANVQNLEEQTWELINGTQGQKDPIHFSSIQIRKKLGAVTNAEMIKEYFARNSKGQILKDGTVLPYGY